MKFSREFHYFLPIRKMLAPDVILNSLENFETARNSAV